MVLPQPHKKQEIFITWKKKYPKAQAFISPCGSKFGKSLISSVWLLKEALETPRLFCLWVAPSISKAQIGYRYMKAMIPNIDGFHAVDSKLAIYLPNGSYIKFLHGKNAEVVIEGEGVDRFVIDEASKTPTQTWISLFTTITQTRGFGIITGTPRGHGNWYAKLIRKAKGGDPFFHYATFKTEDSPYVSKEHLDNAKRLLPPHMFQQYYLALLVSVSSVFGDLEPMWDESLKVKEGNIKWWIHPDEKEREGEMYHGVDVAKLKDYTVYYSVNDKGKLVGFCRYRRIPYTAQAKRLELYIKKFFSKADNSIRYDQTGVGEAFGDCLLETDIDADITGVTFTVKSKQEMVTKTTVAIEQGWHKVPRIEQIEHEFSAYEVSVSKTGLHTFRAPEGDHDDVVSAAILAISGAYQSSIAESVEKMIDDAMDGKIEDEDIIEDYADALGESDKDYFDDDEDDEDFEFDEENA
jgi:hypothetical protein